MVKPQIVNVVSVKVQNAGKDEHLALVHVAGTLVVVRPWCKARHNTKHGCCTDFIMCFSSIYFSSRALDVHISLQAVNVIKYFCPLVVLVYAKQETNNVVKISTPTTVSTSAQCHTY